MLKARNINRVVLAVVRVASVLVGVMITILALGSSCQARYQDVSSEPKYAKRVGQRCMVLKGLRAHGITLDLGKKVTEEVDVTALPGFGGPEVTFTAPVLKGTIINVIGARECWNCPFGRIDYEVNIPEVPQLASYHVFARAEDLSSDEVQCSTSR
jgi:hypothetical protein